MIFLFTLMAQEPVLEDTGLSFGWLFLKTIIAMVIVIVLAFVFIRYIMPRLQLGRKGWRRGSSIKIIERTGLDPRKALYIIQVGRKIALIGTSDNSVNKIMDLEEKDIEDNV